MFFTKKGLNKAINLTMSANLSKETLMFLVQENCTLIGVALLSVVITFLASKAWRRNSRGGEQIPGHLGLPFIGETFSFLSASNSTKGCYEFVRVRRLRYGKWFKTRMFGKIHVFAPSAEAIKRIYSGEFVDFNKGYIKSMEDIFGKKSLACVPPEGHKRIRRLLSDPFSMPSLREFVPKFDQMLSQRLEKLTQSGKSFKVFEFSMKMIFEATCDMLLSITEDSKIREIEKDITAVSDAMLSFPDMIPGTRYYRGMKARQRLMETFRKIIEIRRGGVESRDDFLQSMLERDSYPSDEKLDDAEIMDNLLILMTAGQDSTAAAMMWSVKFLDENREVLERLREEQLSIPKNKQDGAFLTLEDLNSMSYGSKVVKETLRMSNTILWFPRVALNDCTIDGFKIKKGWHVNVDATYVHYDPDVHKDPLQFKPSRFEEMQKPFSYMPFGSGARTCLGLNMAKTVMLVFLHRLTSGHRWTVDDVDPSLEKKALIPKLRSGYPITLKPLA